MPPKKKVPEGEMTSPELRKLIRAHNKLTKITIPKGTDREGIIKIIEKNGYKVNHPKKRLDAQVKRGKQISMKKADEVLPKPKTKEQKAVEKKARDMKKKEATDKIKAEGVRQGAALQRVVAKRKAGKLKDLKIDTKQTFDTVKKLETFFNKQLEVFRKKKLLPFVNKIKAMTDIKQIQTERKELRKFGEKNVLDILETNEELFEDKEEKYEELEERYDNTIEASMKKVAERISELKK
tara:strand:+ start:3016 stop:3729 length:714 start_codon:yes stop_codon:yes gene_type:complete